MGFNTRMSSLPPGALAKIGRSKQHTHELLGSFTSWTISNVPAKTVQRIAEDRLSWTVHLGEFPDPPFLWWSLIAGDAIHNLRSALDVAVYELGDAKSLAAKEQERVTFPLVTDPDRWADAAQRLAVLPTELVERIESVQPFQRPEGERETDALRVLHLLDIADKHRLPLAATTVPQQVEHSFEVEFEVEPEAGVDPKVTVHMPRLTAGALLVDQRTTERIVKVRGQVGLQFQLSLDVPGVGPVGVTDYLENTGQYVWQVVAALAGLGESHDSEDTG